MATVEVTQENFHRIVSGNNMVIVDFWAPWCGPCRGFAPVYEAASEKYPDVVFAKVNTEAQPALDKIVDGAKALDMEQVRRETAEQEPAPAGG